MRRQGWARPHDAPLLSWEAVLGNLLRWPWVALGIGYAVCDSLLGRAFAFKVTPKGVAGARPLPAAVLAPCLLLAAAEAGAALLVRDAGRASGYYYLTLLYGATYVAAAGAAAVLHAREQGARLPAPALRPAARLVARPLALAVVAGALAVTAGAARWDQTAAAVVPPSLSLLRPPGGGTPAVAQPEPVVAVGVVARPRPVSGAEAVAQPDAVAEAPERARRGPGGRGGSTRGVLMRRCAGGAPAGEPVCGRRG